jgi:hypothetical protein
VVSFRRAFRLCLMLNDLCRIGKKSTRLVNAAAVKLCEELFNMIDRPDYAVVTRVREGTEPQVLAYFVTQFAD